MKLHVTHRMIFRGGTDYEMDDTSIRDETGKLVNEVCRWYRTGKWWVTSEEDPRGYYHQFETREAALASIQDLEPEDMRKLTDTEKRELFLPILALGYLEPKR